MTRNHDLKTIQPYFDDIAAGRKTFEMRVNDRQFQPGDTVTLREFNPKGACKQLHDKPQTGASSSPGPDCQYTGRTRTFRIGYVLSAAPGVPLGEYVVFSLEPLVRMGGLSGSITTTPGPIIMHVSPSQPPASVARTINTAGQPMGGNQ